MTRALVLLLLFASTAKAATVRFASGDRIRVRAADVSATVSGRDTNDVTAANVRRAEAHVIEVVATNGMQLIVPRGAAIEWVGSGRAKAAIRDVAALRIHAQAGEVRAERIRGNVEAKTANGNVIALAIGGNVLVDTGNGNVTISGVEGLVDVTSGNGRTFISNVKSGVNVVSINASANIRCIGGSVNVKDTSGATEIANIAGDLEVFTALGRATYSGNLAASRSYRLRTLDGSVTLAFSTASGGFIASLASDAQKIEGDAVPRQTQKRLVVRRGDERARVVLDAVGGRVALMHAQNIESCR
jgi:hypothetical protein